MQKSDAALEVTQRTEFSCCYLDKYIDNTGSEKYRLNAYQYKLEATVQGLPDNTSNKLIDFKIFKKILKEASPEGQFLYDVNDQKQVLVTTAFNACNVSCYPIRGSVSVENILKHISQVVDSFIESNYSDVHLKETKLRETASSYVTWRKEF